EALAEAQVSLNKATVEVQKEIEQMEVKGLPPPAPRQAGKPKVYTITLPGAQASKVNYRWVELSAPERRALALDSAAKDDQKPSATWKELARARGQAIQLPVPGEKGKLLMQGALFYSRPCRNKDLTEEQRQTKQVDYYVLVRNDEFDPKTGKVRPALTGRC